MLAGAGGVNTNVNSDIIAGSANEGFDIICPPELMAVMCEKIGGTG